MSDTQPFIAFITGSSGSGKTTLYKALCADLSLGHIEFHDIDEETPPPVARGQWRQQRVANLLFNAISLLNEHAKSTVICGITLPSEVIEQRFFRANLPIHFIHINPSDEQIRDRLTARIDKQLTSGQWNESFNDETRITNPLENIQLNRILQNAINSLRRGTTIDASILSKDALAEVVKETLLAYEQEQ